MRAAAVAASFTAAGGLWVGVILSEHRARAA
jgi:hypothetical protein